MERAAVLVSEILERLPGEVWFVMVLKGWIKCCMMDTQTREFQVARLAQTRKEVRPKVCNDGLASLN